ncbi:hypothetical protein M8C21_025117 [Ambrosia artemisiifolia]|uniref:Uncharacterized protein n=1 Tax=Ambrosia artemisiifolia TaxID=4212 RepID=A0AAD5GWD4_AMBAR|nr:hypothetical protein M8C21_025117 [Ambrosia artemisiifolia]
MCVYLKTL